jgi:Carboxypeptidase regulatory-like domain
MSRQHRRTHAPLLTALTIVSVICALTFAIGALGSDPETLGPVPPACTGANYEFGTCTVATRLGALSLSPHIVHAGGTITGTIALTGPYKISWPRAIPQLVQVTACGEHDTTCEWKVPANAPTAQYTVLGVGVINNQGVGISKDYYAIIGKDRFALSGQIKDAQGNPVPGVAVQVAGTEEATLTTDSTGSYNALLKRGSYTVTPRPGHSQTFEPQQAHVSLTEDRTVDFALRPNVNQVSVSIEPSSLPASGLGVSGITISDHNSLGEPVEGATIKISPPLAYDVPALLCDSSNRLVYPTRLNDGSLLGGSFQRVTDSAGEIHLNAFFGTVPGSWLLEAGEVSSTPSQPGLASATLSETGGPPELPQALTSLLIAAGNSTLANFGQSAQRNVLEWLGQIQGQIGGVGFLPIHSSDASGAPEAGVVIYANNPAVRQSLLNYLSGASSAPPGEAQAVVIDIANVNQLLLGSRLAGQAVNTTPYRLPSLSEWANGTVIQIADADVQAFHNQTHIPISARGRPQFGMVAPTVNAPLLYGYGPYPPFAASAAIQSAFNQCVAYTFATSVTPHSPVTVLLRDQHGDATGVSSAGASAGIPGSLVRYAGHALRSISAPSGSYRIAVVGTGNGPATLVFTSASASGSSSRVFHFQSRRGAKGQLIINGSQIASTLRFAGHTVDATNGLALEVHGLPKRLRKGKATKLSLSISEQLGHRAADVTVHTSGAAGSRSASANNSGALHLTLRPSKRGRVTLVFSGPGLQTLRRTLPVS